MIAAEDSRARRKQTTPVFEQRPKNGAKKRTAGDHHGPLRARQHHPDLEPPSGRLGQITGRRSRRERYARPLTAPRPRAQMRPPKLAYQNRLATTGGGRVEPFSVPDGQSRWPVLK